MCHLGEAATWASSEKEREKAAFPPVIDNAPPTSQDMAGPTTFLQKVLLKLFTQLLRQFSQVFCEISLEKRPDLWQDDEDTEEKNVERITFLATFSQTEYRAQLDPKKSTTRKNEVLAKALKEKGNKSYASGDNIEAMNHYNQALRFSSIDQQVVLVGD